eukprot:TRINITY_DN2750_c0_g1_i1.p1 TRINITY_DN2750_c0_g1~~TRINITY_DN2750_c0_g1_i1.p1  ORF type:complete len:128 (-),score=47.52 TRINITY_DN2750_c0_g1_i1:160-507(-)
MSRQEQIRLSEISRKRTKTMLKGMKYFFASAFGVLGFHAMVQDYAFGLKTDEEQRKILELPFYIRSFYATPFWWFIEPNLNKNREMERQREMLELQLQQKLIEEQNQQTQQPAAK